MTSEAGRAADQPKMDEMGVDSRDVEKRKAYMEIGPEDEKRLGGMHDEARGWADSVIKEFYGLIMAHPETRAFFRDQRVLDRVAKLQKDYFLQLTGGEYGMDYVRSRLKIGLVHQRINLPLRAYFGSYSRYLRSVAHQMFRGAEPTPATDERLEAFLSLLKLVFFDISLALESHVFLREQTIHKQQQVIRELSTPVLQLRDRLLIAPLIGMIDTLRARQLTEQVLRGIRANRAKVVVIDITGVAVVDSAVANHLIQTVQASRLMGARVIITGVSAEIAQTLVRIGVDLSQLDTLGDLQEGIIEAERILGLRVVPDVPADPDAPAGAAGDRGGEAR